MERNDDMAQIPQQYQNLVRVIGAEAATLLCKEYGGERLYIPKMDAWTYRERRTAIKDEYNGANIKRLAKKYNLTERMIQIIVKGVNPVIKGQVTIDDLL